MLCLTGEVGWARLSTGPTQVVGATPIALFLREHAEAWLSLARGGAEPREPLAADAERVLERLQTSGASFAADLAAGCALDEERFTAAIGALVAAGLVTSDGFAGLRAIVGSQAHQRPASAGRWSVLARADEAVPERAVEMVAWALLGRYGVMFRRLMARETSAVPWRDLARVYRRLEARGEIRGGRFVTGVSGEQFALPAAVEQLREVRRSAPDDRLITIGGADPLNLTGIVTHDERIRAASGTRIVYRNGVAVAAMEGDMLRTLAVLEPALAAEAAAAAAGRRVPVVSGFVGRLGSAAGRPR
jgi:ATP-dependent Lhr-like helicase